MATKKRVHKGRFPARRPISLKKKPEPRAVFYHRVARVDEPVDVKNNRSSMSTRACTITLPQPTAVMFLREQGQDGEECERAAKALGAQVIRKYVQLDGTGSIMHPILRCMIDELLALRDAQYVIVTSLDRLTRRADVMATILREIQAAGAELVTATTQTDTGIINQLNQIKTNGMKGNLRGGREVWIF